MGLRLAISVMLLGSPLGQLHFLTHMQLDFDYTTHAVSLDVVGTESSKRWLSDRGHALVELVHSPEQGKNPLDFPKPQQKTQVRIFAFANYGAQ